MSATNTRYLAVGSYAARTIQFARTLAHAHELGYQPGDITELTSEEFHRLAVPVYLRSLPVDYLHRIEAGARKCASVMNSDPPEHGPIRSWFELARHHLAAANAIAAQLDLEPGPAPAGPLEAIDPALSGLLRYDELAVLVHPDGVAELEEVSIQVHEHCRRLAYGSISDQEISWLRALARGERTIEVAARYGHSERSFYRALARLWERLGVENRAEALALAAQVGWLGPSPLETIEV